MKRDRRILHRPEGAPSSVLAGRGWRARPLAALLGLRPPAADHSAAEGAALGSLAERATIAVELGVSEGASACAIATNLPAGARLWCIDPYPHGHLFGRSAAELVARRLLRGAGADIDLTWVRATSDAAAAGWCSPIDLLVIDGEHTHDAVHRDWTTWSPHVLVGGHVVLRWRLRADDAGLTVLERLHAELDGWTTTATYDDFAVLHRDR